MSLLLSGIKILVDARYKGIKKIHKNIQLPTKKTRNNSLNKEKKRKNQELSKKRIIIENIIGSLKRFKIIADKYRNRRKCFSLRFNLIAGIHNLELII